MKNKLVFTSIFTGIILLTLLLTLLWSNKSCTYCFQSYLAENYIFENKDIGSSTPYIDNTINIVKHRTTNVIGKFVEGILKTHFLNLLFWIFISTLAAFLFYRRLFNLETSLFSTFIFLTNPTLNVTIEIIVYYFLALFFIYKFLTTKKILLLLLLSLSFFISLNVDISPSFVILITSFFIILFYLLIRKEINKKIIIYSGLFVIILIIITIFEKNFISDLINRMPSLFDKLIFYIFSYPKTPYFYLYIFSRVIFLIIPLIYLYNVFKEKLTSKETFILSYLLTIFPLTILFILFDISARVFDYYTPLLAAISFKESKKLLNPNLRKKLIILTVIFSIFFSIFLHFIPPRSLEVYNNELIEGLTTLPQNSTVYTDVFVANLLLTKFNNLIVIGPDFNRGDEYKKVYYDKDEEFIKKLFIENKVSYFVISKQSMTKGLDILNAPHFLNPITIDEYNKMKFLEKYYSNNEVFIWRVKI